MANPRNSIGFSRKRGSAARAVGSFVPGLTRKSFEKYGFSTATLLTDWSIIAGRELATFTLPERLKWPRQVEAYEDTAAEARGRPGATLVLRVDGPRAIEVQYQTQQIIERINAHFGYRAVSEVRFIQAPIDNPAATRALAPPPLHASQNDNRAPAGLNAVNAGHSHSVTKSPETMEEAAPDDALLMALDRLHANMTRANAARAIK